jgi:hypothetical protein
MDEATDKLRANESRKLLATFLNNLSVAFFVAAVIQPALFMVQQGAKLGLFAGLLSMTSLCLSTVFASAAHVVIRRLKP